MDAWSHEASQAAPIVAGVGAEQARAARAALVHMWQSVRGGGIPDNLANAPIPVLVSQTIAVPDCRITNVVTDVSFKSSGGETSSAALGRLGHQSPDDFSANDLRIRHSTCRVFANARTVIAGAHSQADARLAALGTEHYMLENQIPAQMQRHVVTNIACAAGADFAVDIEVMAEHYPLATSYDPSNFPGMTMKIVAPKASLILFDTGKCIITGPRDCAVSWQVWRWIYLHLILRYRADLTYLPNPMLQQAHRRRALISSLLEQLRQPPPQTERRALAESEEVRVARAVKVRELACRTLLEQIFDSETSSSSIKSLLVWCSTGADTTNIGSMSCIRRDQFTPLVRSVTSICAITADVDESASTAPPPNKRRRNVAHAR